MKRTIPVFIHHEGRAKYAQIGIRMAEKYNENVIFLGDNSNKDYSANWVDVNQYCGEEWKRFKCVFKNMSYYDEGYAVKIFKRLFAMKNYMKHHGLEECVLIDSDVISYINYSTIPIFSQCDATLFMPREEEKGSDPLSYGNYSWGASAGTSYFKYEVMEDIISFILDIYENHIDLLEKKWAWHQQYQYGGGVCEMTLLFLWYLQTDYHVINTKMIFGEDKARYVIDNDVRTVNDRCNFIKHKHMNIEKIHLQNGQPYLELASGELVRTVCLHFGGETKRYMQAFCCTSQVGMRIQQYFAYIRLCAFHVVAKFYICFLKKYIGKYRKSKYGDAE